MSGPGPRRTAEVVSETNHLEMTTCNRAGEGRCRVSLHLYVSFGLLLAVVFALKYSIGTKQQISDGDESKNKDVALK